MRLRRLKSLVALCGWVIGIASGCSAGEARVAAGGLGEDVFALPAGGEISRAEFRVLAFGSTPPKAILVLCPGQNGDGRELSENPAWREFARENGLGILVPAFFSSDEDLEAGRGYFVASRGSGRLMLDALERMGWAGTPLLLYGFSGGAHFAMSFSAWAPGSVLAFCAYSFAWWTAPPPGLRCPAMVACGQRDGIRYGACFAYFQSGRRQGKPWMWVSLEGVAHEPSPRLESLVRSFFAASLRPPITGPVVADNATGQLLHDAEHYAVASSVLPGRDFFEIWKSLHHP